MAANRCASSLDLRDAILKHGGHSLVLDEQLTASDVELLVKQGELFQPIQVHDCTMENNECHRNALKLTKSKKGKREGLELCSGFGLDQDHGRWYRHSWTRRKSDGEIWETTSYFDKYFGVCGSRAKPLAER